MISVNSPVPEINFWDELVSRVQEIGHRTRETDQIPHFPREQSIRKKRFSRFQVQETWHKEEKEAEKLANRIKYLELEKQRHNRTLDFARKKYERMMEIREHSLKEKDDLRKKIVEVNEQVSKEAVEKASRIKQERFRTSQSVRKVREKNVNEAQQIRGLTIEIQKDINQEKQIEVLHKKAKVESARENIERSRMKLSQMQEERVKLGKLQHKESITKQIHLNLQQHRRNSILRQKLQESIVNAHHSKKERLSLLGQYQTLMTPKPLGSSKKHPLSAEGP